MLHLQTPTLESMPLSARLSGRVLLKLENLQASGSFKDRGLGLFCAERVRAGARGLVSSSGGNAGLAAAHAARRLGVPVTVVVPRLTKPMMQKRLAAAGARVVVHGEVWDEADVLARTMAADAAMAYVSPFDDPLIWQGHATMVDEWVAYGVKPKAVVLSVGGGGLLTGVVQGLQRVGWTDVPVLAVETQGAASLRAAVDAGGPTTLPAIKTLATSLGARRVADAAWECTRRHPVTSVLVSDAAAVRACRLFADEHRMLVEPACGAALALGYDGHDALRGLDTILFVVCGGSAVTLELLESWRAVA